MAMQRPITKARSSPSRLTVPTPGIILIAIDSASIRPAVKVTKATPLREFSSIVEL